MDLQIHASRHSMKTPATCNCLGQNVTNCHGNATVVIKRGEIRLEVSVMYVASRAPSKRLSPASPLRLLSRRPICEWCGPTMHCRPPRCHTTGPRTLLRCDPTPSSEESKINEQCPSTLALTAQSVSVSSCRVDFSPWWVRAAGSSASSSACRLVLPPRLPHPMALASQGEKNGDEFCGTSVSPPHWYWVVRRTRTRKHTIFHRCSAIQTTFFSMFFNKMTFGESFTAINTQIEQNCHKDAYTTSANVSYLMNTVLQNQYLTVVSVPVHL